MFKVNRDIVRNYIGVSIPLSVEVNIKIKAFIKEYQQNMQKYSRNKDRVITNCENSSSSYTSSDSLPSQDIQPSIPLIHHHNLQIPQHHSQLSATPREAENRYHIQMFQYQLREGALSSYKPSWIRTYYLTACALKPCQKGYVKTEDSNEMSQQDVDDSALDFMLHSKITTAGYNNEKNTTSNLY